MSARLRSALTQIPLAGLPPRLLNVGCGAYHSAGVLREVLPGWRRYGVDLDGEALRCARDHTPDLRLVQADARSLPALLRTLFGLILVRHPDLYQCRAAWNQIIPALPALLPPGGALLVALYTPEEVDIIRALAPLPAYPLNGLAPVDLAGHDRYLLAFLLE
jgi:trans-aconitate methyltransferase